MKGFDLLTDPERMKDLLQRQLPLFSTGRLTITNCKIGYAWYKTYENPSSYGRSTLSICYHLNVADPLTKESGEQILYAKAYLENRSQVEFEKMRTGPFVSPRYGEPFIHLPNLDMIVWAFPNDPELFHLPEYIDPEKVTRYFPYENLPSGIDRPEDIIKVEAEIIHYRPGVRCTARYHLKWGVPPKPKEMVLFGKTFSHDQGKVLYQRSVALFRETQRDPDSFLIAQPLGYNDPIKTLWQVGLQGEPLVSLIDKTNYCRFLKKVANGLASFHQSGLLSPVQVTIAGHTMEVKKKIAKLIRAFPRFREPLQSIERSLEKTATDLLPIPDSIIHADFSVQQLLACGDQIACFDFDEFAMGDPTQDIANFIVDCYFRSFDPDLIPLMIATFVHAYERKSGLEISTDHLNWYIQILFITKAYRFYLQQRPRIEEEIEAMIALAQKGIALDRSFKR